MSENGRRRDSIFAGGEPSLPRRPFLNTALFYGALAVVGFVFLLATGQGADRAAIGALFAFAIGTGLTWLRLSRVKREQRRRERRNAS